MKFLTRTEKDEVELNISEIYSEKTIALYLCSAGGGGTEVLLTPDEATILARELNKLVCDITVKVEALK